MTARARFVDSISDEPTVRLDLLTAPWDLTSNSRFDPPKAKRAVASTLMVDGSIYPASAYEDRVLELHLLLQESSSDDAATAVQRLARELDRPAGSILELRLDGQSSSVFFRTIRLAMESVDFYNKGRDQVIVAPVIAEPFAYGLREDPVEDVTVSTDPAAGSNGCFVDVEDVKGDVEAPAIIRWPASAISSIRQALFATRRRGTPSAAPFLVQVEAMTQGTDTTTQTNNASFSGSGNNYSRCTFSTNATMQTRTSILTLGTAGVDLRGRYRVLLRYRKNTATNAINLRLRWGDTDGGVVVTNDEFITPNVTTITTADLGEISVPVGSDPVTGPDGTELVVSTSFRLRLQAVRTSGSGSIDFDFLLLVPADDRLGIVEWLASPADHWLLDANGTAAHARDSSGRVISAGAPTIAGGFPMLTPNQTNRIVMLRSVRATDEWALTTVSPVSVSYYPRYLSVRPAAT